MRAIQPGTVVVALGLLLAGCGSPRERFGKTYYLDGAGNWGFGVREVADGLRAAQYAGDVEPYLWTSSFNPALDQINRPAARIRAAFLSAKIRDYLKAYPENDVNMIALSAGTGVAVWAVEGLKPGQQINHLILLGSSLSHDYDMSKALPHIRGNVVVYYSSRDTILDGPVRTLGTIDGKFGDAAGLVGLRPPKGGGEKIVNIAWSPEYTAYGWTGSHTDCTSEPFVRAVIARHIVGPQVGRDRPAAAEITVATHSDLEPRAEARGHLRPRGAL